MSESILLNHFILFAFIIFSYFFVNTKFWKRICFNLKDYIDCISEKGDGKK